MNERVLPRRSLLSDPRKLREWFDSICPSLSYLEDKVKRRLVVEHYHPDLSLLYTQPYPPKWGSDPRLASFLRDRKRISQAARYVMETFQSTSRMKEMVDSSICGGSLYLFYVDREEYRSLSLPYKLSPNPLKGHFVAEGWEGLTVHVPPHLELLEKKRRKTLEHLRRCLETHSVLFVNISCVYRDVPRLGEIIDTGDKGYVTHALQLLINKETSRYYMVDPAGVDDELIEMVINVTRNDLVSFLNHHLQLQLEEELCPRFTGALQGENEFCAVWVIYLTQLSLLNPHNSRKIYEKLMEYDQEDRDRLIYLFLFWISETYHPQKTASITFHPPKTDKKNKR